MYSHLQLKIEIEVVPESQKTNGSQRMNVTKHTQQMCRQVGIHSVADRDYYMFCGNPISDSTITTVPSTHSYKGLQCAKVLTLSKVAFLHVHAVPVTVVRL